MSILVWYIKFRQPRFHFHFHPHSLYTPPPPKPNIKKNTKNTKMNKLNTKRELYDHFYQTVSKWLIQKEQFDIWKCAQHTCFVLDFAVDASRLLSKRCEDVACFPSCVFTTYLQASSDREYLFQSQNGTALGKLLVCALLVDGDLHCKDFIGDLKQTEHRLCAYSSIAVQCLKASNKEQANTLVPVLASQGYWLLFDTLQRQDQDHHTQQALLQVTCIVASELFFPALVAEHGIERNDTLICTVLRRMMAYVLALRYIHV